jgi:hypothetical protein
MKRINWRYALGELIIVVVGISIAFALNNWAQNNRLNDEKEAYIEGIRNDLAHDIHMLDSNLVEIDRRIAYLQALMPHLYTALPGRDTMAIKIFQIVDPVRFRPNQSTVQSLRYSGDLKLIRDLELRNRIMNHYEGYERVEEEYQRHYNFAREYMARYFMEEIDYSKFSTAEGFTFRDDRYYHNLIYGLLGIYGNQRKVQADALASARDLDSILD